MRINALFFPTLLIAALLFWVGVYADTNLKGTHTRTLFHFIAGISSVPALAYVVYYFHLFDRATWFFEFRALPFTELLAAGIGLAAGIVYVWFGAESLGEKSVVPIAALVILFVPYMKPVLAPVSWKSLSDKCEGDTCLQSTPSTCGPTSAVNVLHYLGHAASERELAKESFTYKGGTENWYMARAMRRRGMRVRVVADGDLRSVATPAIAGVILKGGAGHFIAILGKNGEQFTVIDPLVGRLQLDVSELNSRYRFTGFYMVVSEAGRAGS